MPAPRPPVEQSRAVAPTTRQNAAEANYLTIVDTLKANGGAEAKAIRAMFGGDRKLADKFLAVCFSLLASDSDLLSRATPMSIIESIKTAASLGLEPMTEDAAIVRYGDKAQLVPMYRGYLKRIRNSGLIRAVDVGTVYTEDEFDYGTNERGGWFTHHPAKARKDPESGERVVSRGAYMGFYAYAVTPDGFTYFRYMDVDEVNAVRDTYGRTETRDGKALPWKTAYEQMALKTVIRLLRKMLPAEAVGQKFLEVERQDDEAIQKLTMEVGRANSQMNEVRDLALKAVGQLPASSEDPQEPEADEAPAAPAEAEAAGEPPPPAPEDNPDVAAAMAEAERQEQLRRQKLR